MEVFSGPGAPSPTELEILCEAVGLIPNQRSLLTTTVINAAQLRDLWGVKAGLLITRVSKASVFLDRAGIDYAQLEVLLQCRFVNPPGADEGIKISFDENYPCSLADATLTISPWRSWTSFIGSFGFGTGCRGPSSIWTGADRVWKHGDRRRLPGKLS
jgi:hypothetical protein